MDSEIELLQGIWQVKSVEIGGRALPDEFLRNAYIQVRGNRFVSSGMGAEYEGVLEVDTSGEPRQFNMVFDSGPEKGNTNLGIYELAGNEWKICLAMTGSVRPTSFASIPGSPFALEVLERTASATTQV